MKGNLDSEVLLRVETLSEDNFVTIDSLRTLAYAWSARRYRPTALCRIQMWGITKNGQGITTCRLPSTVGYKANEGNV
jgi:hypothetical protein